MIYLGTYGLESTAASASFSSRRSWKDGLGVTELESEEVFLNPPPPPVADQLLSDGDEARVDPLSLRDGACGRFLSLSLSVLMIERGGVGPE